MPLGAFKTALMGAAGGGAAAFVATGGIITQYETGGTTYRVHAFRGTGKFVVTSGESNVDWLIVAGGGGGNNGGGGAGGMRTGTAFAASETSGDSGTAVHTITVGAGGRPGGTGNVTYDNRGYDSSALGFTSSRGGGGGGGY